MAFSVSIIASIESEKIKITPAWWNYKELLKSFEFEKDVSKGYLDYSSTIDKETFVNMTLDQMRYLNKGTYAYPDWVRINTETMKEIDKLINATEITDSIQILISEWESGLD